MSELVLNSAETLVPVVVDFEGRRWPMFKAGAEPRSFQKHHSR